MFLLLPIAILSLQSGPGPIDGPPSDAVPPGQPAAGPGGADYAHGSVTKTRHGEGAEEFWVFEPADPRPESGPVIVFLHGLSATNPRTYGAWIDHLVRRGATVVYPRFQTGIIPRPRTFTRNTIEAVGEAFELLETAGHVRPDLERVAVVGHSAGGILAANLAALAESEGLPVPRAIFSVQPGSTDTDRIDHIDLEDLSRVPEGTLVLTLAGEADSISGQADALRIYHETTRVPPEDKDFLVLPSDPYGEPDLRSNHLFPVATDDRYGEDADYATTPSNRVADAFDYYGTWRLLDALCAAAFEGTHREFALGHTQEQSHMGTWSDGRPVQRLIVLDPELAPKDGIATD